jgi:hypothetical protein
MSMPLEQAVLNHGTVVNGATARFACLSTYRLPGGTVEAKVIVMPDKADSEEVHLLHPGETFSVRDQTWKLERVENAEDRANWRVHIVRVS